MKFSKTRIYFVIGLAMIFSIFFFGNDSVVLADAVKTQQGSIAKATSLVTTNVIKVPDNSAVSQSSNNNPNRGTSSEFNGTKGGNSNIASYAYSLIGKPYVWGATGPNSFDCSGLTMYVYRHFGVSLPHYTGSQFSRGKSVDKKSLAPGDLVFFNTYSSVSHVGIYIGGGKFIHAPGTGRKVTISSLGDGYYQKSYAGARRYTN